MRGNNALLHKCSRYSYNGRDSLSRTYFIGSPQRGRARLMVHPGATAAEPIYPLRYPCPVFEQQAPFCGAAMSKAHKQLSIGMMVDDRYRVESILGARGSEHTFLCRDSAGGGKRVVLRTIFSGETDSPSASIASEEFSLMRRLRHPNLVHVLDFGFLKQSEGLFWAREWVQGKDLQRGTEGMEFEQALDLMATLTMAVQYLHARGIVHGKLKPSNVILPEGGGRRLRIMDFGLAQHGAIPRPGNGPAMLPYTAPEIFLGERCNKKSDLYSLGILFYQLLARRLPFEDEDPGFMVQKHLQGSVDLRPIERTRGGHRLAQLVRSLLDKDPARRPVSGNDVIRLIGETIGRDYSEKEINELMNHFSAAQLVGRREEMQLLIERMKRVRESGRGWTVFIKGEAGSGKTRCMEELRSWAVLEGCRVVEGMCRTREEGAYGPYRQILANCEPEKGAVLFQFGETVRTSTPGVFESSSEFAAGQFRDLLTRELLRRLKGRPTLLLLHDFHLADEATNAVLGYLSSDIQNQPVLLCVSLRSGDESRAGVGRIVDSVIRQEWGEILALEPLTKESVEQLVEGMTGDSRLRSTLGAWIFKSFGGNPFFLEEVLKHLVEQKLLRREYGKWRFVEKELGRMEIPASIGIVLQKRLEQLPASAREVANWLALFHSAVPVSLLSSAMKQNFTAIAGALQELSIRQMIRMGMQGAEETVEFRHSLIAEVIRGDLPKKSRRIMHRKIAEAIERESGSEGRIQELAMHHIEGNSGSIGVRYAQSAAAQSRAEFAHENALRCFEYIFKNRRYLKDEQLCYAAIEASDTMFALGFPRRANRLLKAEISQYKAIDSELKARMYMQLALSYQHLGDLRMQETYCRKGLRLFRNRPSDEVNLTKAMLWAELAFAAILQSHSRRGLLFLEKARQSCPEQNATALKGRIHNLLAYLHRFAGNLAEALSASKRAADMLGNSGESYLTCSAYSTQGIMLQALGRFPLALEKHKKAISLSNLSRSVVLKSQALGNLAECLCRTGSMQEAANAAKLAAKSVREANNPAIRYAFNTILAEINLASCDYRAAANVVHELDQDAKHNQTIYILGHALYVTANLRYSLGDFNAAIESIEKLCCLQTNEAPFYEHELARAILARILFEQGYKQKALSLLRALERAVAKKRWPYQKCIIFLHISEVCFRLRKIKDGERYAKKALRLATAMQTTSLISHSHLMLGLLSSPLSPLNDQSSRHVEEEMQTTFIVQSKKASEQLIKACQCAENSCSFEIAWRAHAELCRILKKTSGATHYLDHAQKAYELLCKIEEKVPSEMLPFYSGAFGRSHVKAELAHLIESAADQERSSDASVADIRDEEKTRVLLRMSATVNSIGELDPLLEEILDQLIHAMVVERALIFLRDELTGNLQFAKGRNNKQEPLGVTARLDRYVLLNVLRQERPILSANAQTDPRMLNKQHVKPSSSGKLLCAPLKVSNRILGVLYADHSLPAVSLSESTISLFAAFCNIAAMAIDNALTHQHMVKEKNELEKYLHQARDSYREIVGKSSFMELLRDRIGLAAASPLDILIAGESGTGKELVARAIYRTGRRKTGKFVSVDCGSLADSLAEAELFGFRKGTFTGAVESRDGLIEAADGGILFLDEIANLPLRLQAKLLRVLQEREVRPLGETTPHKIDIQVVAATNKDLLTEVRNGQFRDDLYYRLKAFEIRIPPLRERAEDIPLLIEWFLDKTAEPGRVRRFSSEALALLSRYTYPGNVRELKNIVAGSYYSTVAREIGIDDLPPEVRRSDSAIADPQLSAARSLYREILEAKGSFADLVQQPFLRRQYGSSLVKAVVGMALGDSGGKYRDAFVLLRIPETHYASTMQFLKRHKCYLDYRPFRRRRG